MNFQKCSAGPALAPTGPGAGVLPAIPPSVLAQQFWDTIPLPVPSVSIPPGYAITGKPAYLVTGGSLAPPAFTRQTPLGLLTVTARGRFTVHWGDGTTSGPFVTEGRAYPNGNIGHTYDDVGTVTVTVEVGWTATWTLGAASGSLDQLETQATIPGFRIRQVQAVLIHG